VVVVQIKHWLDVPFAEKDEAKAAGARWDSSMKRWYTLTPNPDLAKWAAKPALPEVLPGEDRSYGSGLFVDLVPSTCWFTNVRSCVSPADWERIRRMVIDRAGRCEACGAFEERNLQRWMEVHERWEYDDAALVQRLKRLICLCSDCHKATHFGKATLNPATEHAAVEQLKRVNRWTHEQVGAHVDAAFDLWQLRSRYNWHLDLSILEDAGVTITPPPSQADRVRVANTVLQEERAEPLKMPTEARARAALKHYTPAHTRW